jgi:hypothetical protein
MNLERGAVSIGILVAAAVAATFAVVIVVVVVVIPVDPAPSRPSVRYDLVEARIAPAHVSGLKLAVEIELEVTSPMPHVAPHIVVRARCGNAHDEGDAFFMDLSNARPGDRKLDTIDLFEMDSFQTDPDRCELTLSMSEGGATPPQRFCYEGGRTVPGACR